jgi:hypothetical protein
MRATVEDLRKGDVIIIGNAQGIFDAKLLRQPQLAKVGRKTTWAGTPRWSSVLCAIREDSITRHYINYHGVNTPYITKYKGLSNDQDYNVEKRIDLTDKVCWIIKRETL